MTEPASQGVPGRGFIARLLHEPLVHFLFLTGLLFGAQAVFAPDDREVISVDAATQQFLFQQEEELLLRPLTKEEKQNIVRSFVEEEILVREAVKRGFSDSSRIRTLLLQNMRFFISGDIPEPTEENLRRYFDENPDKFRSPQSLDLAHVMYEAGNEVPDGVRDRLNGGADPMTLGSADFAYGRELRYMDQTRLVNAFGADTTRKILDALSGDDLWHGPFTTQTGSTHFLRVVRRNAPQMPEFETAKDWIATQWMADTSRALMDQEVQAVEADYRIEIEPLPGDNSGA